MPAARAIGGYQACGRGGHQANSGSASRPHGGGTVERQPEDWPLQEVMPRTDEDVFARFRKDPSLTREQAHLAYAAYAEAKYDWVEHIRKRTGSAPTPEQIEAWIADLPDSRFEELRIAAFNFFEEAAEAYMQPQVEAASTRAVEDSILGEVQQLSRELVAKVETALSPSTAWRIGIGAGLAASFLFTVLVVVCGWLFNSDPSPFALIKELAGHASQQPSSGPSAVPLPATGKAK